MQWFSLWVVGALCSAVACSSTAPTKGYSKGDGKGGATVVATSGGAAQGGSAATAGSSAAAGVAGQSASYGPIGMRCEAKKDCAEGLECFAAKATVFGSMSPAGGFCSKPCSTDDECRSVEGSALCADLVLGDAIPAKICVPGCILGDERACGARLDVACWPVDGSSGGAAVRACLPTCNDDVQCPDGTVCNGYVNFCDELAPAGGLELGADCDPTALVDDCAEGFCVELDGGGVCTAYCRRGTFPQCRGDGTDAICGWVFPGDEAAGDADIGMCASTCACDAQCAQGSHCELHPDRVGMQKSGICTNGAEPGIAACP